MASRALKAPLKTFITVLCLASASTGCDDGPTSPIISGVPTIINVTGMWSGSASDAAGGFTMNLTLVQRDSVVSGTMSGTTSVGAPVYSNGAVSGRVVGDTFIFSIEVPRGGVRDDPTCRASFALTTTDLLATSMAGTYTGNDTCGGTFVGGRFQLIKQ